MKIKKVVIFLAVFVLLGSVAKYNASAAVARQDDHSLSIFSAPVEDPDTGLSILPSTGPVPDTGVNDIDFNYYPDQAKSANTGLPSATPVTGSTGMPSAKPISTSGSGVYIPTAQETGLSGAGIQAILINLLRWLLGIVGVVALIGFAISGVQYILAAGSDAMIETAKKNMVNSIMGIVVVLASLVIVQAIDYALNAQRIL